MARSDPLPKGEGGAALPVRVARFRRGGRSSLTTVGPVSNILIRWGGSRAVASLILRILVVILLVVGVPLFAYWPFGKVHAPAVEVHDEVGILQADATASSLENLRFRQDVKLAVLTLDAKPNANFNSEVLGYAREKHPEWISSSDSSYWADGLVILAVSPSGRWTGCYFGEDVKVDTAVQGAIQEAGKNSFREQRWALGIEQMAGYAAEVMGRPIVSPSGAIIVAGLGVISGGALGILMLVSRSGARLAFTRARRHYAQVTADYEGTQIKAELIPTDDAHGAQVLARFAWFEDRYAELTRAFRDFGEPRGAEWFSWRRRMDARGLNTRASELDSLDDAISHASALLTMSEGWQQAWANEQGPVHEDLASFQSLCTSVEAKGHLSTAQDRDWLRQRSNRLAAMTNELSSGRCRPPRPSTSWTSSPGTCAPAPIRWRAGRWRPIRPRIAMAASAATSPRRAAGGGAGPTATRAGGPWAGTSPPTTRPRRSASTPPPRPPTPPVCGGSAPDRPPSSRRRSPSSSPVTARRPAGRRPPPVRAAAAVSRAAGTPAGASPEPGRARTSERAGA